MVLHYLMGDAERLAIVLALAPHVQPHALDVFFTRNSTYDRGFTEFGGTRGVSHGGFTPTGETLSFLLAADSVENRFRLMHLFSQEHFFARHGILHLGEQSPNEPFLSGCLVLSKSYLNLVTLGEELAPAFSGSFPARRITTQLDWEDLVLEDETAEAIDDILVWLHNGDTLMNTWGMARKLKPGYRALFHGPPGTGKTLAATLIAKAAGLDMYRVDLSQVVSKYIGETEKNLENVFREAENKNWILFFDEADALFSKRTQTSSSNDKYANQGVSFLLQRLEDYPGTVILATNLRGNIDEAFTRRFQAMAYFPIPGQQERLRLWQQAFPTEVSLGPGIALLDIAEKYELAGGAILNVCRYCCMAALRRGNAEIENADLLKGIKREYEKAGKVMV
jgi:AAA+ superfamily predicted ATPase